MAEVLMSYGEPIVDPSGQYHARALGRLADDGMWDGWLEFEPLNGDGPVVIGPIESRPC